MKFFVMLAILGAAHRIIRKILANPELIEQWRRRLGLPDSLRLPDKWSAPVPRTNPDRPSTPAGATRHTTQPVRRPQRGPRPSRTSTGAEGDALGAWYLLLDVSPNASRGEINHALKLRLARARSDNDTAAVGRLLRAAAIGIGHRTLPTTARTTP